MAPSYSIDLLPVCIQSTIPLSYCEDSKAVEVWGMFRTKPTSEHTDWHSTSSASSQQEVSAIPISDHQKTLHELLDPLPSPEHIGEKRENIHSAPWKGEKNHHAHILLSLVKGKYFRTATHKESRSDLVPNIGEDLGGYFSTRTGYTFPS